MQSELAGQTVGRYSIVRQIGEGGMGVVFEGRELESQRKVALKSLRKPDAEGDRGSRLAREAKLTEALDHPGIVRVLELVRDGDRLFVVMEFVEGQSLRQRLDAARDHEAPLAVAESLRIVREVASAVAYAHQKGVVHRDLKPENVMLDSERARVLDFGLAKLREIDGGLLYQAQTQSSLTVEGQVLGTPAYMSPEQARGQEVGFKADVFSLGVVLYELLTGERPFTGGSTADVIAALTRDEPPPPSAKNAQVPPAVDALVKACIQKRAEARPTMAQLAEALGQIDLRPTRRAHVTLAIAGIAAAVVALAIFRSTVAVPSSAPPARAAVAAADAGTEAGTEADRAYAIAIKDEAAGDGDGEITDLDRAVKLDPDHAGAHLRLALRLAFLAAEDARLHFAAALARRDRLSPGDDELLEALRPLFQQARPDLEGYAAAMRALVKAHPGDPRPLHELAKALDALGDFEGAASAAEQSSVADPHYLLALATLSQEQAYLGRFSEARSTIARCLAASRSASWCRWVAEFIASNEGDCAALEQRAQDRVAADPAIADSYKALAYSFAATGKPEKTIQEACDRAVQWAEEGFERDRLRLNLKMRLAMLAGRFEDAEKLADQLRARVESRTDAGDHAVPALLSAQLELELGHQEKAGAIAKDFIDRKDAWLENPVPNDFALANDFTGPLLAVAFHAGALDREGYQRALEQWRSHWAGVLRGRWRSYLWVYGYAQLAASKEESLAAVQALDELGPVPPFLADGDLPEAAVGRALWLAGRTGEALPHLKAAAHSCDNLTRPLSWVRAHAWLGDALAESGDPKGACAAYAEVVSRWGASKQSVTARHARERMAALKCPLL